MPLYHAITQALALRLSRTGLTANMLTLCSLPPALLAGACAAAGMFGPAAALMAVAGLLDLLDGALARVAGQETRFGALLDSSLDRIADACVPAGLVVFFAPHGAVALLPVLALISGFLIPYIRARAQSLGLEPGRRWMRRQDRFAVVLLALVATPWVGAEAALPAPLMAWAMGLLAALGALAGIAALLGAWRLDQPGQGGESDPFQ